MSSNALTFSSPPKPTQFEPTLSAHAVNSMDWIARLASETANRVLSVATTIANGACATYGPLEARAPSWRSVSASRITMKCHGRSEEHTSELQSLAYLVCRLLL